MPAIVSKKTAKSMHPAQRADTLPVIVGLGNPGRAYNRTPHSIGAEIVRNLAMAYGGSWQKTARVFAHTCTITMNNTPVRLAVPTVFMNESGISVKKTLGFFRTPRTQLLVIHDDSDLKLGTVKFTAASRSAGHHGIESIIKTLGTSAFARVRIGIRPIDCSAKALAFILKPMDVGEWEQFMAQVLPQVEKLITEWLKEKE
jgi:PTH1 family peptidyl-tRNA hydrolase